MPQAISPEAPAKGDVLYRTTTNLGPFPKGAIFSREQFVRMAPTKGVDEKHQSKIDAEIDSKTYHDDLLRLHLLTGKIVVDKQAEGADEIPQGPHTTGMNAPEKNSGIKRSLAAAQASIQSQESQKQADVNQVKVNVGDVSASKPESK